jgi:hypothetical protein
MINEGSYYALTLSATGMSTGAYISLTPTSELEISQGGVALAPTATSATIVNIYPQTLQIQAPAGMVNAGVTIITSASNIAGAVRVSPPVNVPVVVECWGSELLGSITLEPGQESAPFNFEVSAAKSLAPDQARKIMEHTPKS